MFFFSGGYISSRPNTPGPDSSDRFPPDQWSSHKVNPINSLIQIYSYLQKKHYWRNATDIRVIFEKYFQGFSGNNTPRVFHLLHPRPPWILIQVQIFQSTPPLHPPLYWTFYNFFFFNNKFLNFAAAGAHRALPILQQVKYILFQVAFLIIDNNIVN